MIPETGLEHTVWVVYDLRDPEQWERARQDREAWGKALATVHALDQDVILIAFHPGGAGSQAAA